MADDFLERTKTMQNIYDLFTEVKKITSGRKRHMVHTTMSDDMREMLQKFCEEKHLTLSNGIDMAVFYFLKKSDIDFSGLPPARTVTHAKEQPAHAAPRPSWYICPHCSISHQNNDACPKCGATDSNKI